MTTLLQGDCRDILPTLRAQYHACICDPPYNLTSHRETASRRSDYNSPQGRTQKGFMGKSWDSTVAFDPETWRAVYDRLLPGAHLIAFGGTRTHHRMMVAIEDAGFELRDTLMWVYGSGFPKSHDVSKAIDKHLGAEREVVGKRQYSDGTFARTTALTGEIFAGPGQPLMTAPASPEAQHWEGWGSALKPAYEPIILARKPLDGSIAQNTLRHGVGGLNIEACRIEADPTIRHNSAELGYHGGNLAADYITGSTTGRFPANLIHDGSDEVLDLFPPAKSARTPARPESIGTGDGVTFLSQKPQGAIYDDTGSAARFFQSCPPDDAKRLIYCAKASKRERDRGLEHLPKLTAGVGDERPAGSFNERLEKTPTAPRANNHPTVKPLKLMRYLCKLITPAGGTILDPFAGSGSTGVAAQEEGFDFVGIEMEAEYVKIAHKRLHPNSDLALIFGI